MQAQHRLRCGEVATVHDRPARADEGVYAINFTIWDRRGELILDKRAVLPRFLALAPDAPARTAQAAMQDYLTDNNALDGIAAAEATLRDLSQFVRHAVPWSN